MRMAFGLAAVLVTIGVIVWIMSAITLPSAKQALDVQRKVTPQVQQMAGRGTDGRPASESIKLSADSSGGRVNGFVVTQIQVDGPLEKFYGLKHGDSIVEIGPQPARDIGAVDAAKDFLTDAYQHQQQIVVIRDGQKLTLPAATPAPPPAPAKPAEGSVEKQLEGITAPR